MSYMSTSTHSPKTLLEETQKLMTHLYSTSPVEPPTNSPTHVDFYLEHVLRYHEQILKDLRRPPIESLEDKPVLERVGLSLQEIQNVLFGETEDCAPTTVRSCVDMTRSLNKNLSVKVSYGCTLQ